MHECTPLVEACALVGFEDYLAAPRLEPLATQPETFSGKLLLKTKLGARVPVYSFRQPRRLSDAELPFAVVPVAYAADDARLVVAQESVADSWFPGYTWRVVGAMDGCGRLAHVGWLFEREAPTDAFLGLIARHTADELVGVGVRAPAALAAVLAAAMQHRAAAKR